jgi:hypothetical protein
MTFRHCWVCKARQADVLSETLPVRATQTLARTLPGHLAGVVFSEATEMGRAAPDEQVRQREAARRVYEARAGRKLSDEDLREMVENLVGFFRILAEWARREPEPSPKSGDKGVHE